MLENLHVKNLALIEEEDITFLDGLHILSGETGAGKSIILGALGLALGGKVSKDMLRDPGKEALIEAVFRITRDSQRKQLAELDIEPYDDEVILSRKDHGEPQCGKDQWRDGTGDQDERGGGYLFGYPWAE